MDDNLISGFLSAIFTLSKELSIDKIHVMEMQESKFIYEAHAPFIFILNVAKDLDPIFGQTILIQIINFFESTFSNFDNKIKIDNNLLNKELETINFSTKLDYFINNALKEYYFESPQKILEEIESFLIGLFGTVGEEIINSAIKKVCKRKNDFKIDYVAEFISAIGESLTKKMNTNQIKMILQQLKDIFLPKQS
ncbi:MAG: hypothetical protein ACFFD2_06805 [Promethearchaeota archaeon]